MKKWRALLLMVAFCFLSCEKENTIEIDETVSDLDEVKAYGVGNAVLKAGYGYDVLNFESYDSAIDKVFKKVSRTNTFPKGTKIVIEGVKSEKSIEKVLERERGFGINLAIPGTTVGLPAVASFSFTFSQRKFLSQRIAQGSSKETVFVKATVPIQKHEILQKRPKYSQQALQDLEKYGAKDFLELYGPAWVSSEVTAVEVLHVFTFNFSNLTKEERSEAEQIIGFGVNPYFNFQSKNTLTKEEKRIFTKSFSSQEVSTSLIGFAPRLFSATNISAIFEKGGYRKELRRMINYANKNPLKVRPLVQVLKPYADPEYDDPRKGPINRVFRSEYRKKLRCTANLEGWTKLQARLQVVAKKTKSTQMRQRALRVIESVNVQIRKNQNCEGKVAPPKGNMYKGIKL